MSVKVMSAVFERYPAGGGEMLLALALADVARDDGRLMVNDSVPVLARKTRQTDRGVRQQLRRMVEMGWLHQMSASDGGRGRASVYRIDERWINGGDMQAPPPLTEEEPETRNAATRNPEPRSGFSDTETRNAATRNPEPRSGAIKTKKTRIQIPPSPPMGGNAGGTCSISPSKRRGKGPQLTLAAWLEQCKASGERVIRSDDAVFTYAQKAGLPRDFVALCWHEFKARRMDSLKRQADWRATFRNAVRGNWFRLWFIGADGVAELTTAGRQAQATADAARADEPPTGPSDATPAAGNSGPRRALVAGAAIS